MSIYTSNAKQQVLTWILASFGIILSIGRYVLRYRKTGRFYWDDATHGLALGTMIVLCGVSSGTFRYIQLIDEYGFGHGPDSLPSKDSYTRFIRIQMSITISFWICIYAVKLSFLLLYKVLFVVSTWSNRAWWSILVFTVLTFWVCIAAELTVCGPSKNLFNENACESATKTSLFHSTPLYSCVANVLCDLTIMAFPLLKLRTLRIRIFQKFILATIFSLTLFTIAIDTTRTVLLVRGSPGSNHATTTGIQTALLSVVEANVAVVIGCLPTYRTLFRKGGKPGAPPANKVRPMRHFGSEGKLPLVQLTQQWNTSPFGQHHSGISGSRTDTLVESHHSFGIPDQGINGGAVRDEETGLELPRIAVTTGWEIRRSHPSGMANNRDPDGS